jgi:hypothetical protein
MSGLHFTFSENRLIYMNDNIKSLLNNLMNDMSLKGKLFNIFIIFNFYFCLFYSLFRSKFNKFEKS